MNKRDLLKKREKIQLDFIGIGAQKAGTTWLFNNLKKIEEFDLPPIKELHFFDRDQTYPSPDILSKTRLYQRIFDSNYVLTAFQDIWKCFRSKDLKNVRFYFQWYFSDYDDEWYLSLFKPYIGIKGEITPSYSILTEKDILNMHNLAPNARLLLMLRNPVDRAWSHYRFNSGKYSDHSQNEESYAEIINFLESEVQTLRSDYIRTITNYSRIFPKEQILIGFYDAISENPVELLNEILKFICGNKPIKIDHINLDSVVHKSREMDCPPEIENYLKDKYFNQITQLAETYGGYFNKWYEETYGEKSPNKNRTLKPTLTLQ